MAVYFVTGKLGGGKSLTSVDRIREYLNQGRRIATNLDLYVEGIVNPWARKTQVVRIPDKPSVEHLEFLGAGYGEIGDGQEVDESRYGLLVLDECGTWFNARSWNDKGRQKLINWIIHARKYRWDVIFIVQDIAVMDKQAREMFAEHVVHCKRTDRVNIPIISPLFKMITGSTIKMPKVHIGTVRYGDREDSPIVDRWVTTGTDLYKGYDTEQTFKEEHYSDYWGVSTVLPPWYVYGRYVTKKQRLLNAIRDYKAKGRDFFLTGALLAGMYVQATVQVEPEIPQKGLFSCNDAYKQLYGSCENAPVHPDYQEKKSPNTETDPIGFFKASKSEPEHEDAKVYITGHVKTSRTFSYIFERDGRPFYPGDAGYKVRWISPCKSHIETDQGLIVARCYEQPPEDTTDYSWIKRATG